MTIVIDINTHYAYKMQEGDRKVFMSFKPKVKSFLKSSSENLLVVR